MTDIPTNLLQKESAFFESNWEKLLLQYPNRVLLIHGEKVEGDFPTIADAITAGVRKFGSGPFLVRRSGEDEPVVSIPALSLGILKCQ
ncbi:MAG: hypothetical protein OXF08_02125 [Bacteroidetes bacterium]|nr:hypothetical protein [Bacteroidota bacterium]